MSEMQGAAPRSRLRQRQQRRQQKQQVQQAVAYRRRSRTFPQLRPRGKFHWPRPQEMLNLLQQGVPLLVAIVVVVLITAGFMYFNRLAGGGEVQRPNALWLGPGWDRAGPTVEDALDDLLARAKRHDIGTFYIWVSVLTADHRWLRQEEMPQLQESLRELRERAGDFTLFAWLSVPLTPDVGGSNIQDEERIRAILEFSRELVRSDGYDFDGVLLNLQPLPQDDEPVLRLLRRVRGMLQAEDALLALAATPDYHPYDVDIPAAESIQEGAEWSTVFKEEMALLADELVLQAHNSYLDTGLEYSSWLAHQVQVYLQILQDLDERARFVVDLPTYDLDEAAMGHSPAVENVTTFLRGLNHALAAVGEAAEHFSGIAIYRDWETSEAEWNQFHQQWVREQ